VTVVSPSSVGGADARRDAAADAAAERDQLAAERDALSEERERLANEREALASEREVLADERERLADEFELLLDRREQRLRAVGGLDWSAEDEPSEAEARLLRLEAKVLRAVGERERAEVALERSRGQEEREKAATDRSTSAAGSSRLSGTELGWARERRDFVADERDRLADAREIAASDRDRLADEREHLADARDLGARSRDRMLGAREGSDPAPGNPTAHDPTSVRAVAQIQRADAREQRSRSAAGRVAAVPIGIDRGGEQGLGLISQFFDLTQHLFATQDFIEIAHRVLDFGLDAVPGCASAGVTIVQGTRHLVEHITTDAVAQRLDDHQLEQQAGPMIVALGAPTPVRATTTRDSKWSTVLAPVASDLGVTDALAYGLATRGEHGAWDVLGVLTLYSESSRGFSPESEELGSILAAYLAVAAAFARDRRDLARREAALHRALGTRDVIGQAKGILMERQRIRAGEAFDILRRTSQRMNVRLHEVAERLAETGEIDIV
jgi:hypothetical protein